MTTSPEPILLDAGPSPHGWHPLELVLRCPRLYAWTMAERAVRDPDAPPTAPALVRGSLLHVALAHRYARMKAVQEKADPETLFAPKDAVDALIEKWRRQGAAGAGVDEKDCVLGAYRAYEAKYPWERWRILHVEEVFTTQIAGHPYTARFDLVVEDVNSRVKIVDHKSGSAFSNGFEDALQGYSLSGQFLGAQIIGRERWGTRFDGVLLNFVSLALPYACERRPIDPAPAALASFPETVREAHARIARWQGLPPGVWPAVFSEQTCRTIYGACRFRDRCRWG